MRNILLILITSLLLSSCYRDVSRIEGRAEDKADISGEVGCTSITKKSAIETAKDLEESLGAADRCEALYLKKDLRLKEWTSIADFKGVLEGEGHTIRIESFQTGATGLIKKLQEHAQVKDLNIILENTLEMANHIGVLASENAGRLVNIKVGSTSSDIGIKQIDTSTSHSTGGLIGQNIFGIIENCSSSIKVSGDNGATGGLVGLNKGGNIINSYAKGDVTGARDVGGLVGNNGGNIINSYATGDATGEPSYEHNIGGFVGWNEGSGYIKMSYATGDITSKGQKGQNKGYYKAGGFVGYSSSLEAIENSYSTGKIKGVGSKGKIKAVVVILGGFVGHIEIGLIDNCYSMAGSITNENNIATIIGIGQFAGYAGGSSKYKASIKNSFTIGAKTKIKIKNVGKNHNSEAKISLIKKGAVKESIFKGWSKDVWSFENGRPKLKWHPGELTQDEFREKLKNDETFALENDIVLKGWETVKEYQGKLSGSGKKITIKSFKGNKALIENILGSGEVKDVTIELQDTTSGTRQGSAGVLAAVNLGKVEGVKVIGIGDINKDIAGGLIGINYETGHIKNCFSELSVSGDDAGGLIGRNYGVIERSYARGEITGSNAGGLVGINYETGHIKMSYAKGKVDSKNSNAGGLVGRNRGVIERSYARGEITGSNAGGLVGRNYEGSIKNSYAISTTNRVSLVGQMLSGSIQSSFTKNGMISGDGGSYTLAAIIEESKITTTTFTSKGWSKDAWRFEAGQWPKLKWEKD